MDGSGDEVHTGGVHEIEMRAITRAPSAAEALEWWAGKEERRRRGAQRRVCSFNEETHAC
jgi:hypothetical protein